MPTIKVSEQLCACPCGLVLLVGLLICGSDLSGCFAFCIFHGTLYLCFPTLNNDYPEFQYLG